MTPPRPAPKGTVRTLRTTEVPMSVNDAGGAAGRAAGGEANEVNREVVAARMVVAADLAELLPLAADESLSTDEWWARCEPRWRGDPAYLANLEAKAAEYGREWVRENLAGIHGHWKNSLQLVHMQAFSPRTAPSTTSRRRRR